jgi:hypothetical protein
VQAEFPSEQLTLLQQYNKLKEETESKQQRTIAAELEAK